MRSIRSLVMIATRITVVATILSEPFSQPSRDVCRVVQKLCTILPIFAIFTSWHFHMFRCFHRSCTGCGSRSSALMLVGWNTGWLPCHSCRKPCQEARTGHVGRGFMGRREIASHTICLKFHNKMLAGQTNHDPVAIGHPIRAS